MRRVAFLGPAGIAIVMLALTGCGGSHAGRAQRSAAASAASSHSNSPSNSHSNSAGKSQSNLAAPLLPGGTASATSPSSASAPALRSVTILGSGDVLIHPPLWQQAAADAKAENKPGYDFGPIYAGVAAVTKAADLSICEMETPLAPPQGPFVGWPNFNAPPQVLTALKAAGYDSCTTASNHTLDQGYTGVKRTLDELDTAGLKHTGSARTAKEAATPLIITTANGAKIAQLAYSFNFNGIAVPAHQPWLANETQVPTILAAAHRAKQAGANIVVLSMHWGTEYDHNATSEQTAEAEQLLASPDIDVILGDHAHVVQPFSKVHGKWVAYCMGNQISRHEQPINDNREGVMPRFTFTETKPGHWTVTKAEAIPTWMDIAPRLRLIDLPAALADPNTPAGSRATYAAAYRRITGYLDSLGAIKQGLDVVR
ncbi:MAG TPA: CapA family protein [Jatrophihabitans sp.]|jgi:poly-gamma-glutamate synthesis protein (capsule biosynthesis protein)